MTISVSVVSHAFFSEKGVSRALPSSSFGTTSGAASLDDSLDQQAETKADCGACECAFACAQGQDCVHSAAEATAVATTPRMQSPGCCSCRESLMSPRSAMAASPSPRKLIAASPSPRLMTAASPSPRTGGGKSQGKKKGNRKRGARRRTQDPGGGELKEAKTIQIVMPSTVNRGLGGAQIKACMCHGGGGSNDVSVDVMHIGACACRGGSFGDLGAHMEVDVMVREVREECSSALGIVKEDLELFGLCHLPSSCERATLLKDKSGVVHLGVMVRNSDLNLRSIEELVIHKDKAEQDAERYCFQMSEKTQDFHNLKLKYDKLIEEVLRLRTMVNRANHLRRESEKATEILRMEFEKLVKSLEETPPRKLIQNAST
eukprot:c17660_g1_i2 orf=167-1291(+)